MHLGCIAHAQFGIECARRGIPVAIYDRQTRTVFVLLPAHDKSSLPSSLIERMGQQLEIHGQALTRGGSHFLVVENWQPAGTSPRTLRRLRANLQEFVRAIVKDKTTKNPHKAVIPI